MSSPGRLEMLTKLKMLSKLEMLKKVENINKVENETSSILRSSDTKKDDHPRRGKICPSRLGVGNTALCLKKLTFFNECSGF